MAPTLTFDKNRRRHVDSVRVFIALPFMVLSAISDLIIGYDTARIKDVAGLFYINTALTTL